MKLETIKDTVVKLGNGEHSAVHKRLLKMNALDILLFQEQLTKALRPIHKRACYRVALNLTIHLFTEAINKTAQ